MPPPSSQRPSQTADPQLLTLAHELVRGLDLGGARRGDHAVLVVLDSRDDAVGGSGLGMLAALELIFVVRRILLGH